MEQFIRICISSVILNLIYLQPWEMEQVMFCSEYVEHKLMLKSQTVYVHVFQDVPMCEVEAEDRLGVTYDHSQSR